MIRSWGLPGVSSAAGCSQASCGVSVSVQGHWVASLMTQGGGGGPGSPFGSVSDPWLEASPPGLRGWEQRPALHPSQLPLTHPTA